MKENSQKESIFVKLFRTCIISCFIAAIIGGAPLVKCVLSIFAFVIGGIFVSGLIILIFFSIQEWYENNKNK